MVTGAIAGAADVSICKSWVDILMVDIITLHLFREHVYFEEVFENSLCPCYLI